MRLPLPPPLPAATDDPVATMEAEYALPFHWMKEYRLRRFNRLEKQRIVFELLADAGVDRQPVDYLDVGCGDGRWTADIGDRLAAGSRRVGIDFSPRAIGFARLIRPDMEFLVGTGAELELADRSFDLVSAIEVIEHVPPGEEEGFLAEIHRVLRPGGSVVLTTPSVHAPVPQKHFRHYTPDRLVSLLEGAGLAVDDVRGFMLPCLGATRRVVDLLVEFPVLWKLGRRYHRETPPERAADLLLRAHRPLAG